MLTQKTVGIRQHILDLLENGDLRAGEKIQPARDLAVNMGTSFLKTQQALESLVQDCILQTRNRQGTYVRQGWQDRILHDQISIFNMAHRLPWVARLQDLVHDYLLELRFTHVFQRSDIEPKTTFSIQQNPDQYMDLSGILKDCYPEASTLFFDKPFAPFRSGNQLYAIPFTFSPRVIFFNADLFRQAGCPLPSGNWTWEDFLTAVRKLKVILPNDRILNYYKQAHVWINYIHRSGGNLLIHDPDERIVLDQSEVYRALSCFQELGLLLEEAAYKTDEYHYDFRRGKAAMILQGRQLMETLPPKSELNWQTVPMPIFPGGEDITTQATDAICVRKSCKDLGLARETIKLFLSEHIQDFMAEQRYSIPIRVSSASKTIDLRDPSDALFAAEMSKLGQIHLSTCPGLLDFILTGIEKILTRHEDLSTSLATLTQAANTFKDVHDFRRQDALDRQSERARIRSKIIR